MFPKGSAAWSQPPRSAGSFRSSWAWSNPEWSLLNAVSKPTPYRKSGYSAFPFCCFEPLETLLQALLKCVFCRNRTRDKVRLVSEHEHSVETELATPGKANQVFCTYAASLRFFLLYPPCTKGFFEHMRPLQFAMVFANDDSPISGASSSTITSACYPNVIIWLAHHGFILLSSVTP